MCTLALVRRRFDRFPLLIAANRDENLARPSTPPQLWKGPPPFVAGRDLTAGGTWLGINARGLVVGVTNHWTGAPPDPRRASRGHVVRDLLGARDLDEVVTRLGERDPRATNSFLLIAAQRDGRAIWAGSDEGLIAHPIESEVFAIGNQIPAQDRSARARRLGLGVDGALPPDVDDPQTLVAALAARLGAHAGDRGPLDSVCVHTDRGYGTVSSTILLVGRDPDDDRLHHAPGAPCTHAFEDHSDLLAQLRKS